MYASNVSSQQTQAFTPESRPLCNDDDTNSSACRKTAGMPLAPEYARFLHSRSINVAEHPQTGLSVRLLDLRDALASPQMHSEVWNSRFLPILNQYYAGRLEVLPSVVALNPQTPEAELVVRVAQSILDIRRYPAVIAELGERVIEELQKQEMNTDFLARPLPLGHGKNTISRAKHKVQYKAVYDALKGLGFAKSDVNTDKIKSLCEYSVSTPIRTAPLPEANWLDIFREVLSSEAAKSGLGFDFHKTPFFIGFIEQPIADEIAKETLYIDHLACGNILHGPPSHLLQNYTTSKLTRLSQRDVGQIIDCNRWTEDFDLNPGMILQSCSTGCESN